MKLLTASQIREADNYTIKNEPIPSIDLMERAARQCTNWITDHYLQKSKFKIFTGPGNNGGDGLAIARQLIREGHSADVYQVKISDKISTDSQINLSRLSEQRKAGIYTITKEKEIPDIQENTIIIDAIFGSGLSRPVEGLALKVINFINNLNNTAIAIDIPSGLFSESNQFNNQAGIIKADYTLSFQVPKLSFFIAKNDQFVGKWVVLNIGLNQQMIDSCSSNFYLITDKMIREMLKPRTTFDHKGTYGHALLVAGSLGKMGAAILGARACLKTGCGLLTVHVPREGISVLQVAVPEAMVDPDDADNLFTSLPEINSHSALGIGPGIGIAKETQNAFKKIINTIRIPLVIDADGLNIIAQNDQILNKLPKSCILTPHPKEFERIAGKRPVDFDDLNFIISFAKKHHCFIIYKEAYTKIALPDGRLYINSTGNPGMATAGSGDALTGMILSLLAQGYSPEQASLTGAYIHGLAGDIYAKSVCEENVTAGDIINNIGAAIKKIKSNE